MSVCKTCSLQNPTIKKHLLEKFADSCDSAAVHLKAAALPGQRYHVIIPVNTLKDNEIYAPNYENGTQLALIRYPHGGIFEIPILTVNNKNKLGKSIISPESVDAVGINHKIADQLSGADFDGDTVMCIPTNDAAGKVKIKNKRPLKGLEGFDPKVSYGGTKTVDSKGVEHYTRDGHEYPIMKDTQKQMGVISNLITDMTLGGASEEKLARAVRHPVEHINPDTGEVSFTDSTGTIQYKVKKRTQPSTKMAETDDAMSLVSSKRHERKLLNLKEELMRLLKRILQIVTRK